MIVDLRRFFKEKLFFSAVGLVVTGACCGNISRTFDDAPPAISGTLTTSAVVAITFDHSWGNKFTPAILAALKERNVKATFFIMGPWAAKYPDVARQIVSDGHEVASHGYKHENYGDMSRDAVKTDIQKAHEKIKEITGKEVSLIRPPNGHYSSQSLKAAAELGYKTIIWNVDSLDWKNPGKEVIIARVLKKIKPGAIILLHASDTPQQTAEALPQLLDKITEKGYKFVTVGELLATYSEKGISRH